jgi:transposase
MQPVLPHPDFVVGIDIAACSFTASWAERDAQPSRALSFDQSPSGFLALRQRLATALLDPSSTLLVLEATSTYWVALAVEMHSAGFSICVVNPRQVHAYAQSLPRRAKTDPRDAQLLVLFGHDNARKLPRWTPPPQIYHELRQRLSVRESLMHLRVQAQNQRHALQQWPVQIEAALAPLEAVIEDLQTRLECLEREIATLLRDGAWASSAALLGSIIGIGTLTTATVLVTTLNFELASRVESLAAYAGLAPLAHDSGSSVRGRRIIGGDGNRQLRRALYLATLSAAQYNPVIKRFYERLRANGKPMKVARCAAARKLLELAWAVVKKGKPFDPAYQAKRVTEAAG